jgi:hypothetical protein
VHHLLQRSRDDRPSKLSIKSAAATSTTIRGEFLV